MKPRKFLFKVIGALFGQSDHSLDNTSDGTIAKCAANFKREGLKRGQLMMLMWSLYTNSTEGGHVDRHVAGDFQAIV